VELTPRTSPEAPTRPGRRRRGPWPSIVVGLVVVALGLVAWQGLTNAAVYFQNADEAVAKRDELGDRRFRLQGTVVEGTVERSSSGAEFDVTYNEVSVSVRHAGSTPELFQPGIPVVLEGAWADRAEGDHFVSDRILVKHTEEYEAEHEDRLDEAEDGRAEPTATTAP
jgi:cytochrome c-type biogenesis protein CcmE